jgi:signal peptide peptidase SppA
MPKSKRKRLRQLRSKLFGSPWSMHPPAFHQLLESCGDRETFNALDPDRMRQQLGITSEYPNQTKTIDGVAVVPLVGVLVDEVDSIGMRYFGEHSYQVFERDYAAAMADNQVKAVLLLCNTPGGSAVGVTRAAEAVYNSRGTKPVFAYCHYITASAGYYIAAAADRVLTHSDAMIGSVGTIYVHTEQSQWMEDIGLKATVITHGERKGDGNPYEPLSDGARASLQRMVASYGEPFEADVAKYRGIDVDTVREQYGQGEAFRGNIALSRGMVDAIVPNFDAAMAAIREHAAQGTANVEQRTSNVDVRSSQPTKTATSSPTITQSKTETGQMKKRILAALLAKGLIQSTDLDDATYTAILAAYFRGSVPDSEEKILAGVLQSEAASGQPSAVSNQPATGAPGSASATGATGATAGSPSSGSPAANVQAAHNSEMDEANVANAERNRVLELQAKAQTLGDTGFVVSAEQLTHAIENGTSVADAANLWTTPAATTDTSDGAGSPTGESPVRIVLGASSVDTFQAAAVEAVSQRFRPSETRAAQNEEPTQLSQHARDLRNTPLWAIAMQDLQQRGERVNPNCAYDKAARIDMCSKWLSSGGSFSLPSAQAGGAAQTAADFPNLTGSLVARMLDQAIELADATYREWTARTPDLPDLRPQLIVSYGGLNTLDQIGDDEKAPQLKFTEETPGWMQVGRYANKVALTAVMMANNDLDSWGQGLNALGAAVERTVNGLCLGLLTGNVQLLDGHNLFDDTNHGNDVTTGGGVPSEAQATKMKQKHRRQTGIGQVGRVKTPPSIALVPTEHEENADKTFLLNAALGEVLQKTTDASLNTHRGKVTPIVEPDLEDTSTDIWYTLADPMRRRTIVHGFMSGFGNGGRRTSWYEPDEDTRYTKIEVAAAAAIAGFRGVVRNSGTA